MSESPPPCGWCGKRSVTEVVTVPGRKNKRTAPVCEAHAKRFESEGQMTIRLEVDRKLERERTKGKRRSGRRPWR